MKTLKFTMYLVLCLMMTAFSTNQASACCSASLNITGPSNVLCTGSPVASYSVSIGCSNFTTITLNGGTFSSLPSVFCVANGATASVNAANNVLTISGIHGCTFTMGVFWTPGASNQSIVASANSDTGSDANFTMIINTPPSVTVSGPSGVVCKSFSSGNYSSSITGGGYNSREWTVLNGGGAPPVNISSPNGPSTSVSGFVANQIYYVNHQASCNGNVVASASTQIFTVGNCFGKGGGDEGQVADVNVVTLKADDKLMVFGSEEERDIHAREMQKKQAFSDGLQVYPNPVRQGASLFLKFTESDEVTAVRILDASGRVLKNMQTYDVFFEVETATLPAGMYFLQVENDGNREVRKLSIVD